MHEAERHSSNSQPLWYRTHPYRVYNTLSLKPNLIR